MAHGTLTAAESDSLAAASAAPEGARLGTILHVQWALAIACAYLVLFGRESGDPHALGPLVVAGFLATNLVVGRLRPALAESALFGLALAAVDALLIVASLYLANQLSIELILLCLGILILAIAGLRIGPIALATLALTASYLAIVWFTGDATLWRSSVLLRVPLLFTAAIVYAWLVELGTRPRVDAIDEADEHAELLDDVAAQWEAIQRCQAALSAGATSAADAALCEVAAQNQALRLYANTRR
ncbi:MAG: hypothetical protein ACRERC_11415 [Candidatus Binatia bacterium]